MNMNVREKTPLKTKRGLIKYSPMATLHVKTFLNRIHTQKEKDIGFDT